LRELRMTKLVALPEQGDFGQEPLFAVPQNSRFPLVDWPIRRPVLKWLTP